MIQTELQTDFEQNITTFENVCMKKDLIKNLIKHMLFKVPKE